MAALEPLTELDTSSLGRRGSMSMSRGRSGLQTANSFTSVDYGSKLDSGAEIEGNVGLYRNGAGEQPLHLAAANGSVRIAQTLLEAGAEIDGTNHSGETALFIGAREGHESLCLMLLAHGASPFVYSNTGKSPEDMALATHAQGIVSAIRNCKLHRAAAKGQVGAISRLVRMEGVALDALDPSDRSALGIAAAYGHLETVRKLLELGASVSAGLDPLRLINSRVKPSPIADVVAADIRGLLTAARKTHSKRQSPSKRGRVATQGDHLVARAGANDFGVVAQMLADGVQVDLPNSDGRTALHEASAHGHYDVVKLLLDSGADKAIGDARAGNCAIHLAAANDHADVVALLVEHTGDNDAAY